MTIERKIFNDKIIFLSVKIYEYILINEKPITNNYLTSNQYP